MQALPSPPPGLYCLHLGNGVQSANPQEQVAFDVQGLIQETTDVNGVGDGGKLKDGSDLQMIKKKSFEEQWEIERDGYANSAR